MLAFLFALQGCTKYGSNPPVEHFAFTAPAVVAPANASTVHVTGTTVDLTWASTNESGDPVKADVYFGTSETPELYAAGHNALSLSVPVELGVTYFWHVTMIDANGITTRGETWSFTVFEPIGIFTGDFVADEPAEDYSYDISFAKFNATTLVTDNYWNSGWIAYFTMDFTQNTYNMPLTTWGSYSGEESGTIDPETGTMVGNYTIYHPAGTAIETGVHTYTKVTGK